MYIRISWHDDFDDLMLHLRSKYGKELFTIDGIGEQLDLNKFSKNFFKNTTTTADVSVDANANVVSHTGVESMYSTEKNKNRNSLFC